MLKEGFYLILALSYRVSPRKTNEFEWWLWQSKVPIYPVDKHSSLAKCWAEQNCAAWVWSCGEVWPFIQMTNNICIIQLFARVRLGELTSPEQTTNLLRLSLCQHCALPYTYIRTEIMFTAKAISKELFSVGRFRLSNFSPASIKTSNRCLFYVECIWEHLESNINV